MGLLDGLAGKWDTGDRFDVHGWISTAGRGRRCGVRAKAFGESLFQGIRQGSAGQYDRGGTMRPCAGATPSGPGDPSSNSCIERSTASVTGLEAEFQGRNLLPELAAEAGDRQLVVRMRPRRDDLRKGRIPAGQGTVDFSGLKVDRRRAPAWSTGPRKSASWRWTTILPPALRSLSRDRFPGISGCRDPPILRRASASKGRSRWMGRTRSRCGSGFICSRPCRWWTTCATTTGWISARVRST